MIAKAIEERAPAAPGPFRASGEIALQWAEITGGGASGAPVVRVRVSNCRSRDLSWALREIGATQALAQRRSRAARTYRLLVAFRPGERPVPAVIDDAEDTLVAAVGLGGHQRLSALQDNGERIWLQVAVNKVHPATLRTVTPFYDRRRLMAACGALEAKHGLVPDHHRGGAVAGQARPGRSGAGGGRCS